MTETNALESIKRQNDIALLWVYNGYEKDCVECDHGVYDKSKENKLMERYYAISYMKNFWNKMQLFYMGEPCILIAKWEEKGDMLLRFWRRLCHVWHVPTIKQLYWQVTSWDFKLNMMEIVLVVHYRW